MTLEHVLAVATIKEHRRVGTIASHYGKFVNNLCKSNLDEDTFDMCLRLLYLKYSSMVYKMNSLSTTTKNHMNNYLNTIYRSKRRGVKNYE